MDLPTRKQNRLREYDYSTPNAYFITICTHHRQPLFWKNVGAIIDRPENVQLTDLGKIVQCSIMDIPKHYPTVVVENFVVMPNHVHMLLRIHNGRSVTAPTGSNTDRPETPTISTVIRLMKGAVTKLAGFPVWQKGFYDHVIRNEKDFLETWNYIEGNPSKWAEDKLYQEHTGN